MDLLNVATFAWGVASPALFYWLGRRQTVNDSLPNIRPTYARGEDGVTCRIEIHARTSEDMQIVQVSAKGLIHAGEADPVYSDTGFITALQYDFQPSPRAVDWLVPGNEVRTFSLAVRCKSDPEIALTLRSSSSTFRDRLIKLRMPAME